MDLTYDETLRRAMRATRELNDANWVKAQDARLILDQYENGDIDRETCIRKLMSKCRRSRETALINVEAREQHWTPSSRSRMNVIRNK